MAEEVDINDAIRTIVEGGTLDAGQAAAVMDRIMSGEVTPAQVGALVTGLRMRGETVDEIAGFAAAMREHALRVEVDLDASPLVDTCGTGGDASGTFNISTTAALQARQPLRHLEMRLGGSAGRTGGGDRVAACGCRALRR